MPADATPIITAARQRHELTRARAIQALRQLDRAGAPVSFEVVARTAAVSRSWLYTQADIKAEIQRLRTAAAARPASTPPVPADQRTSDASARARLQAALERNRALAAENQRLRRQLAQALGQQRQPASRRTSQPAYEDRASVTIEPCQQETNNDQVSR
jgi:hypothetical protein